MTPAEAAMETPGAILPADRRLRLLVIPIAGAIAIYVAIILWAGVGDVGRAFVRIGFPVATGCLGLACLNFALRHARWQLYLRRLGHRIAWGRALRIYLTGFALTVSPGKLGENIRAPFLKRLGVPWPDSLSTFLNERLCDLFILVVMSTLGVFAFPRYAWVAIGVAIAVVLLVATIGLEARLAPPGAAPASLPARAVHELRRILRSARASNGPATTLAALGLGTAAWAAEALVLVLIAPRFGVDLPIAFALFLFAAAILAGAVSFVPAGIGGTEAVMALLLTTKGLQPADAVAAALVMRLTTLWFAVLVGAAALQIELIAGRRSASSRR